MDPDQTAPTLFATNPAVLRYINAVKLTLDLGQVW